MALPSDVVWEVQTTGSDTGAGGGFSNAQKGATGVDMTQGAGQAVVAFTSNLSATGTTTLTCSAALFTNTMLGNVINISGQGFYCIQGFTDSQHVTVDRALGTFSTTSGWVGGAFASPGFASSIASTTRCLCYIKAGTYSVTSVALGVAGGCFLGGATYVVYIGYSTNRSFGNRDTQPVIQVNVSSATLTPNNVFCSYYNLTLDGNNQTSAKYSGGQMVFCVIKNFTAASGVSNGLCLYGCLLTGNSATTTAGTVAYSEAYGNTATPWIATTFIDSLSYSNTGASTDGFGLPSPFSAFNCVAASNGRDGFHNNSSGNNVCLFQNCISESNTGFGFGGISASMCVNCSTFGNGSGSGISQSSGCLTPSATVFTGNPDFSLNNIAARGAALRAAGAIAITNVFPRGLTTAYPDIGAAQHQDSGGGNIYPIFD